MLTEFEDHIIGVTGTLVITCIVYIIVVKFCCCSYSSDAYNSALDAVITCLALFNTLEKTCISGKSFRVRWKRLLQDMDNPQEQDRHNSQGQQDRDNSQEQQDRHNSQGQQDGYNSQGQQNKIYLVYHNRIIKQSDSKHSFIVVMFILVLSISAVLFGTIESSYQIENECPHTAFYANGNHWKCFKGQTAEEYNCSATNIFSINVITSEIMHKDENITCVRWNFDFLLTITMCFTLYKFTFYMLRVCELFYNFVTKRYPLLLPLPFILVCSIIGFCVWYVLPTTIIIINFATGFTMVYQ